MIALILAITAASGVYMLATPSNRRTTRTIERTTPVMITRCVLERVGLGEVDPKHVVLCGLGVFAVGIFVGWAIFGGLLSAIVLGVFVATMPLATLRRQRERRLAHASDDWPKLIDEIRLRCGSLGQPIPHALFEVGRTGPPEYRHGFAEAEREWLISTDFSRAIDVLKRRLDDATADIVCETLLIANSLGGSDIERRLVALVEDRRADVNGRKDARSKQSGVRFARRFVLVVPIGMALVGMSIGNGRDAYASPTGQFGVSFGLAMLGACWWWAGNLIKLPVDKRVLRG